MALSCSQAGTESVPGRGAATGSRGGDKPLWPQEVRTVAPAAFQMPLRFRRALSRAYEERQVRSAGRDTAGPVRRPPGPRAGGGEKPGQLPCWQRGPEKPGGQRQRVPWQVPPCRQGSRSWQGLSSCSQRSPAGQGTVSRRGPQRPPSTPRPPRWGRAGWLTLEASRAQALELVLAGWHAGAAVPAGLALTRGAGVALPDAPAAQEAVGEVQPLPIHRHLWAQGR